MLDSLFYFGDALGNLGRFSEALTKLCEAIASDDKVVEIKPDDDAACYNRACGFIPLYNCVSPKSRCSSIIV